MCTCFLTYIPVWGLNFLPYHLPECLSSLDEPYHWCRIHHLMRQFFIIIESKSNFSLYSYLPRNIREGLLQNPHQALHLHPPAPLSCPQSFAQESPTSQHLRSLLLRLTALDSPSHLKICFHFPFQNECYIILWAFLYLPGISQKNFKESTWVPTIFFYEYASLKELLELGLGQYLRVSMFLAEHSPLSVAQNSWEALGVYERLLHLLGGISVPQVFRA